jgi:hypothetical protein
VTQINTEFYSGSEYAKGQKIGILSPEGTFKMTREMFVME